MSDERAEAAAAGVLGGDEETFRALLQSIVDVARAIFGAQASSIFLYDEDADELVFEAVSGQGGDTLVGTRFPSSTGIAGFALVTRQPLVVDDLSNDPRFSRERAASIRDWVSGPMPMRETSVMLESAPINAFASISILLAVSHPSISSEGSGSAIPSALAVASA